MRNDKEARRSAQNTTDTFMTNLMPPPNNDLEARGTQEARLAEADCYRREAHNDKVSGRSRYRKRSYL